jgi:hypothetical protein
MKKQKKAPKQGALPTDGRRPLYARDGGAYSRRGR